LSDSLDREIDIRAILGVIRRQIWTLVGTVVLVVGLALLVVSQLDRRYTAEARMVIDSRDAQLLGMETGLTEGFGVNTLVDTEVEIARSSKVLIRVIQDLGLVSTLDPAPQLSFWDRIRSAFGRGPAPAETAARDWESLSPAEQGRLVNSLSRNLQISRRGLTNVIAISATTPSPDESARLANAVADAYLDEQIDARLGSIQRASAFLRERVADLAIDIRDLESSIDNYVNDRLFELGTPEAQQRIVALRQELSGQELRTSTLRSIESAMLAGDYDRMTALLETEEAQRLAEQRATFVAELASPQTDAQRLAEVRGNLAALDDQIRTVANTRAEALRTELAGTENRATEIRSEMEAILASQDLPNDVAVGLFQLQRDAQTRRDLYGVYLSRLREVEQQSDLNLPDSRVIASAVPPNGPSYPPVKLILGAALMLSLAGGVGLAFLREHYIGGFTSIDQLEGATGLPVLAAVPKHKGEEGEQTADWAIVSQPLSAFSEAVRRVRIGLETMAPADRFCLMVTSSAPGEGKTTLALAIARAMAMTGKSTLLIDADMRHPAVHKYLGRKVEHGLIDFLGRGLKPDTARLMTMKESATNLHLVLGSEASAVATDALLISDRFNSLMSFARESFDVVIIDTPPVGLVVDAQVIAKHADIGLFVVRSGSTNQNYVRGSLRNLGARPDLPIVAVLNQVERGYGYGYRKYEYYYRSGTREV
jgi:capsular exopolysaccharide synthesis family protein